MHESWIISIYVFKNFLMNNWCLSSKQMCKNNTYNEAAEALNLTQYFKTTIAIVVSGERLLGSWLNNLVTVYLLYQQDLAAVLALQMCLAALFFPLVFEPLKEKVSCAALGALYRLIVDMKNWNDIVILFYI